MGPNLVKYDGKRSPVLWISVSSAIVSSLQKHKDVIKHLCSGFCFYDF